jgi:hypothetical protein
VREFYAGNTPAASSTSSAQGRAAIREYRKVRGDVNGSPLRKIYGWWETKYTFKPAPAQRRPSPT